MTDPRNLGDWFDKAGRELRAKLPHTAGYGQVTVRVHLNDAGQPDALLLFAGGNGARAVLDALRAADLGPDASKKREAQRVQ